LCFFLPRLGHRYDVSSINAKLPLLLDRHATTFSQLHETLTSTAAAADAVDNTVAAAGDEESQETETPTTDNEQEAPMRAARLARHSLAAATTSIEGVIGVDDNGVDEMQPPWRSKQEHEYFVEMDLLFDWLCDVVRVCVGGGGQDISVRV